jgi:hypothetical protein
MGDAVSFDCIEPDSFDVTVDNCSNCEVTGGGCESDIQGVGVKSSAT